MKSTFLHDNWMFRRADGLPEYNRSQIQRQLVYPAAVPGSVHLDLVANGVVAHPFEERHEAGVAWIDEADWLYETTFEWSADPANPRQVLRFDGLDTVVDVTLNGEHLGNHDNMFLPAEFDVTDKLKQGENKLELLFQSAVRVGDERRSAFFDKEGLDTKTPWFDERAFVRKAAYMSGWDWGPRLVGCGIWAPVRLLEFSGRITEACVLQTPLGEGRFKLEAVCEVEGEGELELVYDGKALPSGESTIEVEGPLWWPNQEGAQPLQDFEFRLSTGDRVTRKVGLREVGLLREKDDLGQSFEFQVNGRPIWARGANWIPNDSFPGRITRDDVFGAVGRYAKLGFNMLRVWGGGFYESEDFYDACDSHGILVWQDFPYACSYYPDGPDEQAAARTEAEYHVRRLRGRACLALWCGNNENRSMFYGRWGNTAPPRFYGENIYDKVLAEVTAALDSGRTYIESSPWLVKGMPDAPEKATSNSDDHYWDVWHGRGDWCHYRDSDTRFSSEFGFASSCFLDTWKQVSRGTLHPDDPAAKWHDKTNKGWDTFRGYVALHYPAYSDLEEWVYTSQLNQRDAMRFALEHYRGGEVCKGALIWQVNDCWPVQSWALEDYDRFLKVAGFECRRLFGPALICADFDDGAAQIKVANDSPETLEDTLLVRVVNTSGGLLGQDEQSVQLAPGERRLCTSVRLEGVNRTDALVHVALKGRPGSDRWLLLCEPKDLNVAPAKLTATMDGDQVTIHSDGFVFDLIVWDPDRQKNLSEPGTGLQGVQAVSGDRVSLVFQFEERPRSLRARSLAGSHEILGL